MLQLSKKQIKFIKSLHQKKYRQEHQKFILEGEKLVNEALRDKPEIIDFIVIQKDFELKIKQNKPITVYIVDCSIFQSISTLTTPPPVLAVCNFLKNTDTININLKKRFSFYLDNINDPGNLGTILRTADWFGITDIFCSPNTVELYNPKVIQASKGSFLRVHVHYVSLWDIFPESSVQLYAADTSGQDIYSIKNKTGLIILGNEAQGISPEIKQKIHHFITIPKHPQSKAESLNVAMSAAIIASEFSRLP